MARSAVRKKAESMTRILFDQRWIGCHGIGRFASEVSGRLGGIEFLPAVSKPLHMWDSLWTSAMITLKRPDVYFSPGFNPPLFSSRPFVFTIHDLIHLNCSDETSFSKKIYFNGLVRPACQRAEFILTVSEFSRSEIIDWSDVAPSKVVNVGCGVGECFTPDGPPPPDEGRYLLYVGNLKPHKNLPRLLEAFSRSGLAARVRLIMAGNPSPLMKRNISSLQLEKQVVFTGELADDELARYYRGALALVLPSLYEGFGLPALEAMACGTPVVASRVTSIPEVVGDAALFIHPEDTGQIAEAMRTVVNDDLLREQLSISGLERARQFSWQATADKIKDVLLSAALGN